MDNIKTIFFVAGILLFLVSVLASAVLPVSTLSHIEFTTIDQIAADPTPEWRDLAERWPAQFRAAFGAEAQSQALLLPKNIRERPADAEAVAAATEAYGRALDRGRDLYIGEGCWHCHSQYVRGASKEEQRWGPVASAQEYENALYLPQVWGTRRVGPDLSRQWGTHTNDWQAAHLLDPRSTSPGSVMPAYTWYFEPNPDYRPEAVVRAAAALLAERDRPAYLRQNLSQTPMVPNADGLALIAYIQWLGSWNPERPWNAR
ncbi:MAG: c-type cytochrome [Planctomycetota bacterium]|nr:MAG: c-type cytochrome [Planctomycetota bacterium]